MSPPPGQDAASALKAQNRRSASGSASPRPTAGDGTKAPKSSSGGARQTPTPTPTSVHYTLLIRLPFARGAFEDPPQVEWDATKDRKLWKIISKNSRSADIDWAHHAQEFGVTQPFLLQQAAWLYERHFQHVKAQMNKLKTSNAPTPVQGGTASQLPAAVGGVPMKRLGSGGGASRAPSSLSIRSRESPVLKGEFVPPGTPSTRPELSRTPSAATVTQSRHFLPPSSPRQPVQRSFRGAATTTMSRRAEATTLPPADETAPSPPASPSSTESSSNSDDDDEPPVRQSQIFRRPPPFQRQKKTPLSNVDDAGEDDSGDDSPTFLPFAAKGEGQRQREDPSATLRNTTTATTTTRSTPPRTRAHPSTLAAAQASRTMTASTPRGKGKQPAGIPLESSASSGSSAAPPSANAAETAAQHRRLNALSPHHRAELTRLSPRRTGTREGGSDGGTPSMGSSFSDLDDTSITQSALEEALASNLRHGGASRLSTISHAFGSRLYGRGGQQQG